MRIAVAVVLLLSGCSGTPDPAAQVEQEPGHVAVLVLTEAELPVRGARISVLGTDAFADSDAAGRATLVNLLPGRYEISVQARSFLLAQEPVDVLPGVATNVTIALRLDPTQPENPHIHDLWRGQSSYLMIEQEVDPRHNAPWEEQIIPFSEEVFGGVMMPNGAQRNRFFIPLLEGPSGPPIVLPGTMTMRVTLEWEPAELGWSRMGLFYDPPGAAREEQTDLVSPGDTLDIPVDATMWDDGHRGFSQWILHGYHDNIVGQPQWEPGVVLGMLTVRIELEKGELVLDGAHPDLWDGKDSLVLRQASGTSGGSPLGVSRREAQGGISLDEGSIVPPDATLLRLEMWWRQNTANGTWPVDYDLRYRTAGMNPQTTRADDLLVGTLVDGGAEEQHKVYEVELRPEDGDSYYATRTAWLFMPWTSGDEDYEVGGVTFFDLRVTAHR